MPLHKLSESRTETRLHSQGSTATLAPPATTDRAVKAATGGRAAEGKPQDGTGALQSIVASLADTMNEAIGEIVDINCSTHLLALNARIEAARAGSAGAAFGVVAEEMQSLSTKTSCVAEELSERSRQTIGDLMNLIGSSIRGTRLSDLALANIDLVDRNLYERTCDVRWWATDSSLVDALTERTPHAYEHASKRLGVILNAYTVYHDLVLCDTNGNIVANGRPGKFASQGRNVGSAIWQREAMSSRSGDEYGFETAHRSPLVNDNSVLVYSCGVRDGGESNGKLLGVLGNLFNWEDFAQTIVTEVPLSEHERKSTRAILCDADGRVLADSSGRQLVDEIRFPERAELFTQKKGYLMTKLEGKPVCIAHAQAPGFETYSTGWHSLIIQSIE